MSSALKGKKILIVDDEPDVLETLAELLDGCIIDTAPRFETARKFLDRKSYDAAIFDIMGVDGYQLLDVAAQKGIPAVMLTAHALSPESMVKSLKKGAGMYLPKDEMAHIEEHLEAFFEGLKGNKQAKRKWFKRLKPKFDKKFGQNWQETDRDFWRDFEKPLTVSREDLEKVL